MKYGTERILLLLSLCVFTGSGLIFLMLLGDKLIRLRERIDKSDSFDSPVKPTKIARKKPQNQEFLQKSQQAFRHSSVIFVAPYWRYRISCSVAAFSSRCRLREVEYMKKGLSSELEYFRLQRDLVSL